MTDYIDRQAAIEVLNRLAREKFSLRDEFQYYLNALIDAEDEIKALPSAQPEEDCDTCKHGYFRGACCDDCKVGFPSHYERRTDE